MNLDDEVCLCYHVSLRKLIHFARRTRPPRPSLMTGCLQAGTGCGWCIPLLKRIAEDPDRFVSEAPEPDEHARGRKAYISTQKPRHQFDDEADH